MQSDSFPPGVSEVLPGLLVGPTPDRPQKNGEPLWDSLRELGVRAVVNLREEQRNVSVPDWVTGYCYLPIVDCEGHEAEEIHCAVNWMLQAQSLGKVYLHCKEGIGRSPMVMAACLMTLGRSREEAVGEVRARHPYTGMNERQLEALVTYEAFLNQQKERSAR